MTKTLIAATLSLFAVASFAADKPMAAASSASAASAPMKAKKAMKADKMAAPKMSASAAK